MRKKARKILFEELENSGWQWTIFNEEEPNKNNGIIECVLDAMEKFKVLGEWIELSKEPPSIHSENYLVLKNGEIKVSLFRGDWNMFHCDINREQGEQGVSHWMPLPKMPI
jgi:hypothetical protein